jgi:polar amino acid transport system substrate-binding protein
MTGQVTHGGHPGSVYLAGEGAVGSIAPRPGSTDDFPLSDKGTHMSKSILAVLALFVPAAALAAPDCQELVVTGHPYYPPVAWSSGGGLAGAAPRLVTGIAESLGFTKVTTKDFGSWEKAQAAARSGEADVIVGIYKNTERMDYLEYAEPPFMVDPVSIVVRAGVAFPYERWSDLKGKKGVTSAGESYGTKFDNYMARELTVARVPGIDKAFAAVLDGNADYAIIAFYPGRDALRKQGLFGRVAFLPKTVVDADLFVAFSKKSKCLGALKDGFAKALKADVAAGKANQLLEAANQTLADQ